MLERAIRMFEKSSNDGFRAATWENYTRVLSVLAGFESLAGNYDRAIELRTRWLDHDWLPLGEDDAINLLRNNALDHKAAKRWDQAVGAYDQLFLSFPEYGWDDGTIVYLMREHAEAHGLNDLSIAHAELLEPIFHDPRLKRFVTQRATLGHQWAMALWANDKGRGALAHEELRTLIETHKQDLDWTPGTPIPQIYATTLAILRGYYDSIGDDDRAAEVQKRHEELFR